MNTSRRTTMADVAREAGVSLQTVSRAINSKGEINEETKKAILEIADRMGFRPSGIARSLATHRTTTIGLVVIDITNPFFSGVARGVENVAYSHSYNIFLCNTDEDIDREKSALNSLLEKQVDGLILCSSRLKQADLVRCIEEFSYVILINRNLEKHIGGVATITTDNALGAEMAVNHLISRGHKKIALLAGPQRSWTGKNRLQGFQTGLRKHGLESDPKLILYCEPDTQCGFQTTSQLLKNRSDVTAILAYNDLVAVGALQACHHLKRAVPDEIAIIGFDDIPLASLVTPSLTTIRIPKQEIGESAMRTLITIMEDKTLTSPSITFKPELILRSSAP
jgi:LacI family transcriptional regulator